MRPISASTARSAAIVCGEARPVACAVASGSPNQKMVTSAGTASGASACHASTIQRFRAVLGTASAGPGPAALVTAARSDSGRTRSGFTTALPSASGWLSRYADPLDPAE